MGLGGGGEGMRKTMAIEGGSSQKYMGKRGGQEKYFSKTLRWHNVFILKKKNSL